MFSTTSYFLLEEYNLSRRCHY